MKFLKGNKQCQWHNESLKAHNDKCQEIASIGCGNRVVELFAARSLKPKIVYLIDIEMTTGKSDPLSLPAKTV